MLKKVVGKRARTNIALTAAILSAVGSMQEAHAQQMRLEEVIVTAQKRVQSVQDIPVAVTALTKEAMEVNNVVDVNDLSGLAPNMTVRPAVGGVNIPAFNMRGINSYGFVAGSDKQVSIYLDGVYIGSPRGSIFTLPDIQQLEVLRGPQGTLFGRNATGGAISVRTRDPAGELQLHQKVTVGNRDLLGTVTTVDFPSVGPFSAYLTYAKEERDGDIRNRGAGITWDRTAFGHGTATVKDTLGAVDSENIFLSTFFDFDDLTLSYKFDYGTDEGTPRANVIMSEIDASGLGASTVILFDSLQAANPNLLGQGTSRPSSVNNAWSLPRDQTVQGHNLYLEWAMDDELTLKNTLAYRKAEVFTPADISGTSGWVAGPFGPFLPGGPYASDDPFCFVCSQSEGEGDQWSNELQLDYDGELLTLITGVLYYESEDRSGSPPLSRNTFGLSSGISALPGYVVPRSSQGVSYNEAKSYAAYSQAEIHLTEELDLLAGIRYTKDEKSGSFVTGLPEDVPTAQNPAGGYWERSFDYEGDNVDYLIGLNYQLTDSIMVYGKYSTAYVSGGSVAGIEFEQEESKSWELGAKADFFDSRLRTNIALFDVIYENLQGVSSSASFSEGDELFEQVNGVGAFILGGGELEAEGAELEVSVLPASGLTIQATLGYVNVDFNKVNPYLLDSVGAIDFDLSDGDDSYPNSSYQQNLAPEWSGNLSVNYETEPLFDNAYMSVGLSGIWSDKTRLDPNPGRAEATAFGVAEYIPESWLINARVALKDIEFSNDWAGEVAIWGRNITDEDNIAFTTNFGAFVSGNFQDARSYGIDLIVNFQ